MVKRQFWLSKIQSAWRRKRIVWLSGVRRAGKTFLAKTLPGIEYFDCELPRVRAQMEDPEEFLNSVRGKRIVLDEVQRLQNPSELLKIAADHYPTIHILATGSSTLGVSRKFRDTLTGRKVELWLTPMVLSDLEDFQSRDIAHRLHFGGLPPFFSATTFPERDFQEWMDAYWAKDIQELFRLERKYSFQKFLELLIVQSGGIFEANAFARPCEVSRGTITNYLAVLEATFVAHVVRPFSTYKPTEIVAAPKVYAFDTGFVCAYRGWQTLRNEDLGILWEHFALNELHARLQTREIRYWRDKRGHEIDFVIARRGEAPIAIECKWSAEQFDPTALLAFRRQYAHGKNFVVAWNIDRPFVKTYDHVRVHFVNLTTLTQSVM